MTALLKKDCFVLWKQIRIYILLMVLYMCMPVLFLNIFGVIYSATIPYTAMAYDERCKWDQLAAMMPYSVRDLVVSRYILAWGLCGVSALFGVLVSPVRAALGAPAQFTPPMALASLGVALLIVAVLMPLVFRFGVEKSRILMFLLIIVVAGVGGGGAAILEDMTAGGTGLPAVVTAALSVGPVVLPGIAILLTVGSVLLSMKFYSSGRQA